MIRCFYLFTEPQSRFHAGEAHRLASVDHPSRPAVSAMATMAMDQSHPLTAFGLWLAEAINHAFGNPREESAHQPPRVGFQPYTGRRWRA